MSLHHGPADLCDNYFTVSFILVRFQASSQASLRFCLRANLTSKMNICVVQSVFRNNFSKVSFIPAVYRKGYMTPFAGIRPSPFAPIAFLLALARVVQKQVSFRPRTRTWNLLLRRQTPYPLGQPEYRELRFEQAISALEDALGG